MKPKVICPMCGSCDWRFLLHQYGFLRHTGVSVSSATEVNKSAGLTCNVCKYIEHSSKAWREIEEAFEGE